MLRRVCQAVCASFLLLGFTPTAKAQLALTPAGIAAGFGLTTFGTNFNSPLGITFTPDGGVLLVEGQKLLHFATDTDGQTPATAINTTSYSGAAPKDLATVGGKYYMTEFSSGLIVQVNEDTSLNRTILSGRNAPLGLSVNPVTGHLFASIQGTGNIIDIDLATGTPTLVIPGLSGVDGITVSADGTVVYAAVAGTGHLQGYNIATHALVFDASVPTIDGTALGTGVLAGNIFANTNNGKLIEINLTTGVQTTIADHGSRGDFVAVDPNGTLLVTQTGIVQRLTAPQGGGFGNTPEPGAIALLLAGGLVGAGVFLRRRGVNRVA